MVKKTQVRTPLRKIIDPYWEEPQSPQEHGLNLLWWSTNRAALNPYFVEWAIRVYCGTHLVSPQSVAESIGVKPQGKTQYYQLALCRRPQPSSATFTADVERIATFVGCKAAELGALLSDASIGEAAKEYEAA